MELTDERFTINDILCSSDCLVDARVTSSLMITNVSMSDIDIYTCTAMNILGNVNASLQLIVPCKFSFMLNFYYTFYFKIIVKFTNNITLLTKEAAE